MAASIPAYEPRSVQRRMAQAVADALGRGRHLVVEAGTGTGKSLAYLVPLILWAVEEDERVTVSTYTKTLQQQLVGHDLPLLQRALPVEFEFALGLGSANYLCPRRCARAALGGLFTEILHRRQLTKIASWAERTTAGLRSELDFVPSPAVWSEVCRDGDLCLGEQCAFRNECFYQQARRLQHRARVLVVNHHLYLANLGAGERVLPPFAAVVFDEAHTLEDVATAYFGLHVSDRHITYLVNGIRRGVFRKEWLQGQDALIRTVAEGLTAVEESSNVLFDQLVRHLEGRSSALIPGVSPTPKLLADLNDLGGCLAQGAEKADDDERENELAAFSVRCRQSADDLESLLARKMPGHVYWLDGPGGTTRHLTAHMTPLRIADQFREQILEPKHTVILTSATLTVAGSFAFLQSRLGVEDADSLLLGSTFNYPEQVLLYLPRDLPDPSRDYQRYNQAILERTTVLLRVCGGRTFVLFTNLALISRARDCLTERFPELTFFCQGDRPRHQLVAAFRAEADSVLLGTTTFWQGIDVPGRALQTVIITKIPFAVPDDPVTQARLEALADEGHNPFLSYQVPRAVIMLRQGFGRLIRTATDRGLVAVLDPRVSTRSYGSIFVRSLPRCPHTERLEDVGEFFRDLALRSTDRTSPNRGA